MLQHLWVRFIIALQFLTRLPIHNLVPYDENQARKAPSFYPFVGIFIGVFSYSVYAICSEYVNDSTAVLIALLATIWLTGALHEDGFADCCDGFGGGWQKQDILRIMKDSRLGVYGAIGLMGILALKYQLLIEISAQKLLLCFVLGHGLSRYFAILFMARLSYVQSSDTSKVNSHINALNKTDLVYALTPLIIILFWLPLPFTFTLFASLLAMYLLLERVFMQKIGGYTGDCLGAAQQMSEIVIYMNFVIYFNT